MRSRPPIVERVYQRDEAACARALELLLDKPARKEAAPASRPDDAKEIKSVRARTIIPD